MEKVKQFDLKPSPRVLVALTYTAITPIDALCELVDNAIDSFSNAENAPEGVNQIHIELPSRSELSNGAGAIRVSDNGPGMTPDAAEKSLTAGYSSQNAYDRLGMFGMGMNIATGKFARKTRLITATKESDHAIVAELDLETLMQQKDFIVQPEQHPKSQHFADGSGTTIELTDWWRAGNPNEDFPKKLVYLGANKIRERLGRRYATLLRPDSPQQFEIFVQGELCEPFEHCVWGEKRFVKHGSEHLPARQTFDELLNTQTRCMECNAIAEKGKCPVDSSHPVRSVEERVRGWIGVQRFDHTSHFGIDLIRKGRAIRVFEHDAFFTFTNQVGETLKDYPIDGVFGRFVGEVHLDHVRVDFTKQNFDRATPEWQQAMDFLRGKSSLQAKQPGASENTSPMMKIFRGYRRIRKIGLGHMCMGEWSLDKNGEYVYTRIRETENEFYERFLKKEEGYYEDTKWWELVERSASPPQTSYEDCSNPECEYQNPVGAEQCEECGTVLKAKDCIGCGEKIPQSAQTCEHCGKSQVPEGPWSCGVCGHQNSPDLDECRNCNEPKGSVNVFDPDLLAARATKDDDLSEEDIEIDLPGGGKSQKFSVETRIVQLRSENIHMPAVVVTDTTNRKLHIYLDKSHSAFASLQLHPEHVVAAEAAAFIRSETGHIGSGPRKYEHNLTVLQNKLLDKYWKSALHDDPDHVRGEMRTLLEVICEKMVANMQDIAEEIFEGMPPAEKNAMVLSMQASSVDISEMGKLKESGAFLHHIPPETVISVFRQYTGRFFDKTVWNLPWNIPALPDESVKVAQDQLKQTHLNCLEDGVGFLRHKNPPLSTVRRARLSIEILQKNMAD